MKRHVLTLPVVVLVATMVSAGCGDKCEVLCANMGNRLRECKPDTLSWNDLGAHNRNHFVNECRQQWDRERVDLSASDLRLSLQACADTNQELAAIDCEEVVVLYGSLE